MATEETSKRRLRKYISENKETIANNDIKLFVEKFDITDEDKEYLKLDDLQTEKSKTGPPFFDLTEEAKAAEAEAEAGGEAEKAEEAKAKISPLWFIFYQDISVLEQIDSDNIDNIDSKELSWWTRIKRFIKKRLLFHFVQVLIFLCLCSWGFGIGMDCVKLLNSVNPSLVPAGGASIAITATIAVLFVILCLAVYSRCLAALIIGNNKTNEESDVNPDAAQKSGKAKKWFTIAFNGVATGVITAGGLISLGTIPKSLQQLTGSAATIDGISQIFITFGVIIGISACVASIAINMKFATSKPSTGSASFFTAAFRISMKGDPNAPKNSHETSTGTGTGNVPRPGSGAGARAGDDG